MMFRTLMSLVTAVSILTALQPVAAIAQTRPTSHAATKPAVGGPINLNTASAAELEALPGVGAKTAALIVEFRTKNGPFKKVEELMNVRGIGEKNFLKLKPQITVSGAKADHDQARQQ
jgi:competence protein ComEA